MIFLPLTGEVGFIELLTTVEISRGRYLVPTFGIYHLFRCIFGIPLILGLFVIFSREVGFHFWSVLFMSLSGMNWLDFFLTKVLLLLGLTHRTLYYCSMVFSRPKYVNLSWQRVDFEFIFLRIVIF